MHLTAKDVIEDPSQDPGVLSHAIPAEPYVRIASGHIEPREVKGLDEIVRYIAELTCQLGVYCSH